MNIENATGIFHALFQPFSLGKAHGICGYVFSTLLLASCPLLASAQELHGDALLARIRQGNVVLLMRHAQTVEGVGDPPGFRLNDCATQRNLSEAGKAQARRTGEALRAAVVVPTAVRSSPWCRCKDTAQLAFGKYEVDDDLKSVFDNRAREPQQSAVLKRRLLQLRAPQIEVWVMHQFTISALVGGAVASGEIVVVSGPQATVLGRLLL